MTKFKIQNSKFKIVFPLLVIAVAGIVSALPSINTFPSQIHAWGQSDWYSLAIGFLNNGLDFFHPETLIYNKQFPDLWQVDNGTTVTSVDFPIHVYIVALLMRITGITSPWVFRVWTLAVSLAGLVFLYLLAYRLTRNLLKSITVVLFALFSPLYIYYFDSFLPSAPAIALVFVGLWAYVKYLQSGTDNESRSRRYWYLTVALLTLAAMIRTSQAIPLVAVVCNETLHALLRLKKNHKDHSKFKIQNSKFKILPLFLSALAFFGFMAWNSHLRELHGSLFLNYLMPPRNMEEVGSLFTFIDNTWGHRYFSPIQYHLTLAILAGALLSLILKKILIRHSQFPIPNSQFSIVNSQFSSFLLIYSFGALLFFIAMMRQYHDHDYYFLDSLFIPVVLVFMLLLRALTLLGGWLKVFSLTTVILLGGSMYNAAVHQNQKFVQDYDRATHCGENYDGSASWLDSLGVSRDAKILTLLAYPQNVPMLKMERCGYSAMWDSEELIENVLAFDYDYITVEDSIIAADYVRDSALFGRLQRVAGNGKISLCLLSDSIINRSSEEFFAGLNSVGFQSQQQTTQNP